MKILCIYSGGKSKDFILSGLESEHFIVDHTDYQPKGISLAIARDYDLILIEDVIGEINALDSGLKIREENKKTPLIMLLDEYDLDLRIKALLCGFDDVVSIDTPILEVSARMRTLIRRSSLNMQSSVLSIGNLQIDTVSHSVIRNGKIIYLRRKEYELLEYMMHYPNQVLSRQRLLAHVWSDDVFMFTNTVDVHMASVRNKIDKEYQNKIIQTVHGVGYKICDNCRN